MPTPITVNIRDANITSARFKTQSGDEAAPASGYIRLYHKADGLYITNNDGYIIGPFSQKNNLTSTISPTVNDDGTGGYQENSIWIDTTTNEVWRLHDDTTGAADWREVVDLAVTGKAESDIPMWDATKSEWFNSSLFKDQGDPVGYAVDASVKATPSFDDSTRTFTLTHIQDYIIYDDSFPYTITGDLSVQISDNEGQHYIYYQDNVLKSIHAPTDQELQNLFSILALTAIVYWDKDDQEVNYVGEERHTTQMDGATHKEFHFRVNTWYYPNGGLSLGDFDVDGSGNDDSNVHFSISNGTVYDEDLVHNIANINQPLSPISELPIYYLDGINKWRRWWIDDSWQSGTVYSSGDRIRGDDSYFQVTVGGTSGGIEPTWAGKTTPGDNVTDNAVTWTCIGSPRANVRTFIGGSYRLAYNEIIAGSGTQTEISNGAFVLAHMVATNNILDNQKMIVIQGQGEYSTVTEARENALTEVNNLRTIGLPFEEFLFVATVIYQTSNGYGNEAKARIRQISTGVNWVDFRTSGLSGATSGGGGVTSFLGLTDTPSTFVGQSGKSATVNVTENALEFVDHVKTAGDTMTGDLTVQKAATPKIEVKSTGGAGSAEVRVTAAGESSAQAETKYYDGATLAFRFIAAVGNVAGFRYGGLIAYQDRDNNALPIRFYTNAHTAIKLALQLNADGSIQLNSGTSVNEISTSISVASTDDQLPTAKAVYDFGGGGGSNTFDLERRINLGVYA